MSERRSELGSQVLWAARRSEQGKKAYGLCAEKMKGKFSQNVARASRTRPCSGQVEDPISDP